MKIIEINWKYYQEINVDTMSTQQLKEFVKSIVSNKKINKIWTAHWNQCNYL